MTSLKLKDEVDGLQDATLSNVLHGNSAKAWGGITAMCKKDPGAQKAAVQEYFKHWDNTTAHEESQDTRQARRAAYATLSQRYYDLVTDILEHVWGTSFHFCRIIYGEPFSHAITRHEHYLAHKMSLREGQRVLDVGCGIGGPAREIAKFSGVNIVGLNNNDYQNQRAIRYTAIEGLLDRVTFVNGDFMQMRLEPGSFDAVYSIEGTSYAPTLEGVYTEIFRVLKPGGTFAVYELVMTDAYNNDNLEQREIRLGIEQGLGITNLVQASQAIEAIKAAGFELEEAEDLASRPNEIPWYYPITGSLRYVNSIWDAVRIIHMALLRRGVVRCLAGVCEKLGFFPPGTQKIANSLSRLGDSLVKSGEKKLFTPIFIIVAKKPLK